MTNYKYIVTANVYGEEGCAQWNLAVYDTEELANLHVKKARECFKNMPIRDIFKPYLTLESKWGQHIKGDPNLREQREKEQKQYDEFMKDVNTHEEFEKAFSSKKNFIMFDVDIPAFHKWMGGLDKESDFHALLQHKTNYSVESIEYLSEVP